MAVAARKSNDMRGHSPATNKQFCKRAGEVLHFNFFVYLESSSRKEICDNSPLPRKATGTLYKTIYQIQ